jgi:hypothetical protein
MKTPQNEPMMPFVKERPEARENRILAEIERGRREHHARQPYNREGVKGRFFVSWYDDAVVFRSSAESIEQAATEFIAIEDEFERDGIPMTVNALEGLYGDRPLVVWENPETGTTLIHVFWYREGELHSVDRIMRARVTAWMEERLMELTRGKQPQPNNNHRIVGAAKATVMMLAALTGVLVVAWSFLRPQ